MLKAAPNTVIESLACGTPVAGFRIGGLPDLVQNGVNGFLAAPFDTAELARAIISVLEIECAGGSLGKAARALVEERHAPARTSLRYLEIYRELARDAARPANGAMNETSKTRKIWSRWRNRFSPASESTSAANRISSPQLFGAEK